MAVRLRVAAADRAADLSEAVAVLRGGGIVAYATDTLYGLAVDPRDGGAVEKLFAAKGRPADMAVPLIAADFAQAEAAGTFGPAERRLADAFWPGPLSIVVPAHRSLAARALGPGGTVAIRVPAHPVAQRLAAAFGASITSTSANPTGSPATAEPDTVLETMGGVIDLLVDSGPAPGGSPSTIVAVRAGVPVLVRAGAVPWDRVLKSLQ